MVNVLIESKYRNNIRFISALEGFKSILSSKKIAFQIITDTAERDKDERIMIVFGFSLNWLEKAIKDIGASGIHPLIFGVRLRFHILPFSYITQDYVASFYLLTKYIIEQNKQIRRVAFLGFNPNSPHDLYKLEGFTKAINEYGLDFDVFTNKGNSEELINSLIIEENKYDYVCSVNDILLLIYLSKSKKAATKILSGFGGSKFTSHLEHKFVTSDINYYESGKALANLYQFLNKQEVIYPVSMQMPSTLRFGEGEIAQPDMNYPCATDVDFFNDKVIEETDRLEKLLILLEGTDKDIFGEIIKGTKYEDISEKYYVSLSTVKYLLAKCLKEARLDDKKQLIELLKKYKIKI